MPEQDPLIGSDVSKKHIELGTKAETLDRLRPILKSAIILPQIHFTVQQWKQYAANIVSNVQRHFSDGLLIVRSSALSEDTADSSNAGAFDSVLNVERPNASAIFEAINRVVKSYGDKDGKHQVLIQPQLTDVAICGVMFTCDIQNGAPYYVINYDDSGATDKITSGVSEEQQTHYIYRNGETPPNDPRLASLVECAKELESLADNNALDIEFAFDNKQQLYLFQVRPLAQKAALERFKSSNIQSVIEETRIAIGRCNERKAGVAGRRAILSDMSDWNPAELVGSHPRPLALSMFESLITDSAWREARGELGYYNPEGEKLLVTLAGRPYVDVRNSFNSLLPKLIGPSQRERIINESLDYLQARPHLHDKVEFDVATNCFTPSFDDCTPRFAAAGLSPYQIADVRRVLLKHTETLIRGGRGNLASYMTEMTQMDQARSSILATKQPENMLECVRFLVADCRKRGTKGFSAIARMAFVGNAMLRSFVTKGAISDSSYNAFLQSFETAAGQMGQELSRVRKGELPLEGFLQNYGHLRPGTFDISSPRYDEATDLYFGSAAPIQSDIASNVEEARDFQWGASELAAMQSVLRNAGSSLDANDVLEFAKLSIVGREDAKFLFTKNVSDALQLIAEWGQQHSLTKDDLSYLDINAIQSMGSASDADAVSHIRNASANARIRYEQQEMVILPELIADVSDIEHVSFIASRPNFITQKHIIGRPLVLTAGKTNEQLQNRIVFIESADPGYDWIFVHQIQGLVTKYGGAASHMAIRCAEFGLPAAIGVGRRFDQLKGQSLVEIDCANHSIRSSQ